MFFLIFIAFFSFFLLVFASFFLINRTSALPLALLSLSPSKQQPVFLFFSLLKLNKESLSRYTSTHTHTHIYIYIYIYIYTAHRLTIHFFSPTSLFGIKEAFCDIHFFFFYNSSFFFFTLLIQLGSQHSLLPRSHLLRRFSLLGAGLPSILKQVFEALVFASFGG